MTVHDVLGRNALLEDAHDETLASRPFGPRGVRRRTDRDDRLVVAKKPKRRCPLLFVDVSGYTALTERLSSLGRVGSETLTDIVNSCFDRLIEDVIDERRARTALRRRCTVYCVHRSRPPGARGRYSARDAADDPRPAGDPGTRRPGATATVDRPSSRRPPAASLVGFVDRDGAVRSRRDRSVALRGRSPCRSDRHQ